MDEKEGGSFKPSKPTKCQWRGTLNDLINSHLAQCKYHDADKLKVSSLTKQLSSIQSLFDAQKQIIEELQAEGSANKQDIAELKEMILSLKDQVIAQKQRIENLEKIVNETEEKKRK